MSKHVGMELKAGVCMVEGTTSFHISHRPVFQILASKQEKLLLNMLINLSNRHVTDRIDLYSMYSIKN
jgi:hypothetical protein